MLSQLESKVSAHSRPCVAKNISQQNPLKVYKQSWALFTNSDSPDNSESAVSDGAVGLHVCGDGRRLVVGRRSCEDGTLGRALRSALHQRHRHTHGDARVPRGAAYSRHPTARQSAAGRHRTILGITRRPQQTDHHSPSVEHATISPVTSLLFMLGRLCGNSLNTRNGIKLLIAEPNFEKSYELLNLNVTCYCLRSRLLPGQRMRPWNLRQRSEARATTLLENKAKLAAREGGEGAWRGGAKAPRKGGTPIERDNK